MNRTYYFSPATDTHELPSVLRGCPPTRELHLLDLPPAITTYRQPNLLDGLAAWWATSHLAESARSAFFPLAIGCGVIVATLIAGR